MLIMLCNVHKLVFLSNTLHLTSSLCPLDSRCTICVCSLHLQSLVRPKPYVWPLLCVFFPHLCLLTSSLCHKSHCLATGLCLMPVKVAKKAQNLYLFRGVSRRTRLPFAGMSCSHWHSAAQQAHKAFLLQCGPGKRNLRV